MDQNNTGDQYTESTKQENTSSSETPQANVHTGSGDTSNIKLFAIIGYILPFLFFLPLLQDSTKNNEFARFHANQQLILLIMWLGVYVLQHIFYMMFFGIVYTLISLVDLAILVLAIIGIINAAQDSMKKLPVVGDFKILK